MGNSSFFNTPVAYDVIDEGAQGNSFYEGGDAFEKIDPVKIRDYVAEADASAVASEASHQASQVSANASAASAAAAHTSEVNAAASAAAALANKNSTDTNAATATTKAADASSSAAAALASQNAAHTSETNAAASATAANTSKVNAGTSETNAATSAAAALASKNAAATSETNAGNSATAAAGSATAANTSKVNAGTSETNAHTSEVNAAASASTASTQAGIATTKAGQAATSATNAGTSETNALASKNAAATSATNAGTSETNAAASAAAALTSKNNAATSETNAGNSATAAAASATAANTSKVNAATSETNAGNSATAAAGSATAANTSKVNAATSETNAGNSATAAAGSASSALSSLNSFKGQYYGSLASDPTLDPLGNAINSGDMYWNTTLGLKIYNGSSWGVYSASGGAVASVFGRTGAVVAASGDYTFAQIGSKPTTISGYGITDTLTNTVFGRSGTVVAASNDYTFAQIGSKPTTVAGYGITDAVKENFIINGEFRINQRAYASAATLASGAYGHDRWKASSSGGNYSFTQLAGGTQITIAAAKSLIQVIEDKSVAGGSYVLSWSGTAQGRVGTNSATPSGLYAASPIVISGQSASTAMSVEFAGGVSGATLSNVKLEIGSVATPYLMRSYVDELNLCQRYFQVLNPLARIGYTTAGFDASSIVFACPMRAAPSAALSTFTYNNNCSGATVDTISSTGCRFFVSVTSPGNYDFNNGTIKLDAEL